MKWVILTLMLLLLVACSSDIPNNETVNETVVEEVPETPEEMYKTNGDFIPKVNSETAYPELNQTMKEAFERVNVTTQENRFLDQFCSPGQHANDQHFPAKNLPLG